MKTKLLLMLLVALALSPLAAAAEITVENPGIEKRWDAGEAFAVGKAKYIKWATDMWAAFECDNNGGPVYIQRLGAGIAPEGEMTVRVITRYNDDLDAPHEGIRDFEAACQVLTETFDDTKSYKLTVAVRRSATSLYNGYAVQLVAGGTLVSGASYGGYVEGGTVIAEDYNTKTLAPGGIAYVTVIYTPDPADVGLTGQNLQIRLCALEDPGFHGSTSYVWFDDIEIEGGGIVDLGPDMATWAEQGVTMAPEFLGYDASASTYAWTFDPNDVNPDPNFTVTIDDASAATPTITVTKIGPIEVAEVTVKLSVDGGAVSDTMVIKVYDDACGATRGAGLVSASDLDADCDTDIADLAIMATIWLESTSATESIPRT